MRENRLEESDNSIMSMFSLSDYEKANNCSQQSIIHSNYLTAAVPDATLYYIGRKNADKKWLSRPILAQNVFGLSPLAKTTAHTDLFSVLHTTDILLRTSYRDGI